MHSTTHSYLVGAISAIALVGIAVVAFVLLVSAHALQEWPIAGVDLPIGAGENGTSGAEAKHAADRPKANPARIVASGAAPATPRSAGSSGGRARSVRTGGGGTGSVPDSTAVTQATSVEAATGSPAAAPEIPPAAPAEAGTGSPTVSPPAAPPSPPAESPTPSAAGSESAPVVTSVASDGEDSGDPGVPLLHPSAVTAVGSPVPPAVNDGSDGEGSGLPSHALTETAIPAPPAASPGPADLAAMLAAALTDAVTR